MKLIDLFEKLTSPELYHVMEIEKAKNVFKNNMLKASWEHDIQGKKTKGTSFSRNKKFWFHDYAVVKITIDRNKLKANHKIFPLDAELTFSKSYGSTAAVRDRVINNATSVMAEEFVPGDIKQLNRVVTHVEIRFKPNHKLFELVDEIKEWCKSYKIPLTLDPKIEKEEAELKKRRAQSLRWE